MHVGLRGVGHGLKKLAEQLGFHGAQPRHLEVRVPDQMRPAGEIDHGTGQRLVHGDVGMAVAADPAFVAQRFAQRLSQHQTDVFRRVVRVDVQIALGLNAEVNQTMLAEQVEHMVEEADPGRNAVGTGPVEVQGQGHVGFVCFARYGGLAGGGRHGLGPIEVGFAALL